MKKQLKKNKLPLGWPLLSNIKIRATHDDFIRVRRICMLQIMGAPAYACKFAWYRIFHFSCFTLCMCSSGNI